jgi:hypothetical protein
VSARLRIRLAIAGALLLVVAALTGLAGAAMTGSKEEAPSVFTGGTLDLTAGAVSNRVLDATNMRPGQQRTAVLALRNGGTVPAALGAAIKDRADSNTETPLSAILELRLDDCGTDAACATPAPGFTGSLASFASAQLGTVAPGATRYVRVTLDWDATKSDPARQGATTSATLVWQATAGSAA